MTTIDIDHFCPHCGRRQEAVTGPPGKTPKEGDLGLCWMCGGASVWTQVMGRWRLRLPTEEEAAEIAADEKVADARAAIAAAVDPWQAADVLWGSS